MNLKFKFEILPLTSKWYILEYKMAAEGSEKGKSVSFTFSKKKTATKLVPNKEYENFDNEFNSGKDFIHSAEGKLLLR